MLSCLTVSFSYGIVYSRGNRTPESGKKQTSVYLIKRKMKKENFVHLQKETAPPTAAAAAATAAAVEKQKEKMPKGISHQTEKEQENFVYVQKEAAPPTAAVAASAAAVGKQREEKMPEARSNMHVYSSTRIFG